MGLGLVGAYYEQVGERKKQHTKPGISPDCMLLGDKKRGKSNSVNVELAPKNERNGESLERTIFMKRCKHTDVKGKCWNRFCVEKFILMIGSI